MDWRAVARCGELAPHHPTSWAVGFGPLPRTSTGKLRKTACRGRRRRWS